MMEKEGLCVKDNPTKGKIRKKKTKTKTHAKAMQKQRRRVRISSVFLISKQFLAMSWEAGPPYA